MSDWSLESELCRCASRPDVVSALVALGLISETEQVLALQAPGDWRRGGAETYLFEFSLKTSGVHSGRKLLLKAYTPAFSGERLETMFKEVTNRRRLISEHGILTPFLHFAGQGLWIEEWISQDFEEGVLSMSGDEHTLRSIALELWTLACTLDNLGFRPIDVYSDLRYKDRRPVMIDFGSDLGPPDRQDGTFNRRQLIEWIRRKQPNFEITISGLYNQPAVRGTS